MVVADTAPADTVGSGRRISAGRMLAGRISAGRMLAGRISAGRISAGRVSAGRLFRALQLGGGRWRAPGVGPGTPLPRRRVTRADAPRDARGRRGARGFGTAPHPQ